MIFFFKDKFFNLFKCLFFTRCKIALVRYLLDMGDHGSPRTDQFVLRYMCSMVLILIFEF